jgi:hypothetical protein
MLWTEVFYTPERKVRYPRKATSRKSSSSPIPLAYATFCLCAKAIAPVLTDVIAIIGSTPNIFTHLREHDGG